MLGKGDVPSSIYSLVFVETCMIWGDEGYLDALFQDDDCKLPR